MSNQDKPKIPFPNWTSVPNILIESLMLEMSLGELRLYLFILRETVGTSQRETQCSYTYDSLMKPTGLTRNTIITAVKELERKGLIKVHRSKLHTANIYEVMIGSAKTATTESATAKTATSSFKRLEEKKVQEEISALPQNGNAHTPAIAVQAVTNGNHDADEMSVLDTEENPPKWKVEPPNPPSKVRKPKTPKEPKVSDPIADLRFALVGQIETHFHLGNAHAWKVAHCMVGTSVDPKNKKYNFANPVTDVTQIEAFVKWWKQKNPTLDLPAFDSAKLESYFNQFLQSKQKQAQAIRVIESDPANPSGYTDIYGNFQIGSPPSYEDTL